ncbi:unnamed protein product, partial [Strongylus vulgaris]
LVLVVFNVVIVLPRKELHILLRLALDLYLLLVMLKDIRSVLQIFRTCDGRGWAVRALRNIRKGAFIGEYTGELLSDAETARPERTDTYFFETRVGERLYTVDARLYGNFTRFINHSCRPNATVGMVVWEAQLEQLNHICIFATENIPRGKEITISYGQSWWDAKVCSDKLYIFLV